MVITMVTSTTSVAPKLRASSLRREEWNNIGAICSAKENSELWTLNSRPWTSAGAAAEKCDALRGAGGRRLQAGQGPAVRAWSPTRCKAGDLEPKPGKLLQAYRSAGIAAPRVVLAGAGDGSGKRGAGRGAGGRRRAAHRRGAKRLVICLPAGAGDDAVRAAVLRRGRGQLRLRRHQVQARRPRAAARGDRRGRRRALQRRPSTRPRPRPPASSSPANWATCRPTTPRPRAWARRRKKLAKAHGFQCEVLGPKEVAKLGMGSFMARGPGLGRAAALHRAALPGRAPRTRRRWCWWARASPSTPAASRIKPAAEMDEMKFDMGGAASVLGTFRALGELKPRAQRGRASSPAARTCPTAARVKPGDVVTSLSGQTIEVLNTDAEGRLILCDALTYAERFKPRAVIDIATLDRRLRGRAGRRAQRPVRHRRRAGRTRCRPPAKPRSTRAGACRWTTNTPRA